MDYSVMGLQEIEKSLDTDYKQGLRQTQAEARSKQKNVIKTKKKAGFIQLFLGQMSDFMTLILLAAAAASYFSTHMRGDNDIFEPMLILAIVMLNALLGVFQQRRAEKAIDALKKLSAPHAVVLRDGKWREIEAEKIVLGDIVKLGAGDRVSADMRIIESSMLEADESALTGEAMPAAKQECILEEGLPLAERKNMLYQSTSVISGRAKAVVCAVGMDTEMGKIAGFIMDESEEQTPLQKKLAGLGKTLGLAAIVICAAIFVIGISKNLEPLDMFITAVSLAVAAIPEGLPATVTVMLAIGVERMARKRAIVKRLSAVETLGAAQVICTDKTGTLTQNRMTVNKTDTEDEEYMRIIAALASGDGINPTEKAILEWSGNVTGWDVIEERPFDSKRKMMSRLVEKNGEKLCAVKGAAEIVLSKSTQYRGKNRVDKMSDLVRENLIKNAERMAGNGLRVLAVAYRDCGRIEEEELVFCGFVGISDPPRKEAKQAVEECRRAGIQVVMVTGDHSITAGAIAREVGILDEKGRIITGRELDNMDEKELAASLDDVRVFARVTPEQKLRIIKAFRSEGKISAMTGDGVNDAPALKAADIGCSMGKCGTDVAKEASDIVLADDNFATIVAAVAEGRRIFANIRKSVMFLLSSNIGELLCVFLGLVFGWAAPLLAPQLLWINLVTDSLPAVALGLDPADKSIMNRQAKQGKNLFSRAAWIGMLVEGAMIGALALLAYTIGSIFYDSGAVPTVGRTMAFSVLAVSQLVHSFNLRKDTSVLGKGLFENKYLLLSLVLGSGLTAFLISFKPAANLFGVCNMPLGAWIICALLSLAPLVIVETAKKAEQTFSHKEMD